MRSSTWRLEDLRNVILNLGFVGENLHTRQIFDCKKMFDQYPNASVSMTVTPPDGEPYPGTIERDGDLVIWDVRDSDLVAEGDGEIQLVFTQEPHIARSYNARTHICRSQVPTGSIPSGLDDYITRADQLLDQVEDTFPAGGTTGQVLAKKSDTDYDTEWVDQGGGTEDYDELENRPQIGGVTLTGNKTLHDLGAASEEDVAAKYTKPETGIPASDMAAGVIPDPEDLIDDNAGAGDTDKVWSADKSADTASSLMTEINSRPETKSSDAQDVDLDVTDEDGNVILRLSDGGVKTKKFDSSFAPKVMKSDANGVDLDVTDSNGNSIVRFKDGHIETKEFDSRKLSDVSYARCSQLFTTIDFWEPETADSGYSNPTSGYAGDTYRADWTADDKYYYYEFLEHYYDVYLGTKPDGYRVTKRSLGQDSANTGHELFEYDFCPLNYKYTILLSAGMNADETQGIWGLATFIRGVMNKEETNMEIAYNNIRFKVIPIINASGFDQAHLRYTYSDGVNPNFNFNYKDSWSQHDVTTAQKGSYPDSNISTVILKNWLNENAWKTDLWVDLHTGRWDSSYPNKKILDIRVADTSMVAPFAQYATLVKDYYIEKGYVSSTDSIGGTESIRTNLDYQKTVYAFDVCGIKAIMPEMHLESTGYGADGLTNNTVNGIKCYVGQLRAMMMCYINESASANGKSLASVETIRLHE